MAPFLLITLILENMFDICGQINFLILKPTIREICQPVLVSVGKLQAPPQGQTPLTGA